MESTLSEKLNEYFDDNIKYSFVSNKSVVIITKNDKTYEFMRKGLKAIRYSALSLKCDNSKINKIMEESIVEELCFKSIIDIKCGKLHSIALTSDGGVYSWGYNDWGILGIHLETNSKSKKLIKPQIISDLTNENVIMICCGSRHSLILTINGEVYGWGQNNYRQISSRKLSLKYSRPIKIDGFHGEFIKSISCGAKHSLALTVSGKVYGWGQNKYGQLNDHTSTYIDTPKLILESTYPLINISCGYLYSTITDLNTVYVFGDVHKPDFRCNAINFDCFTINESFIKVMSKQDVTIGLTETNKLFAWGQHSKLTYLPILINFEHVEEAFEYYLNLNYGLMKNKIIRFSDKFTQNGKFELDFVDLTPLGEGSYGQVYAVKDKRKTNVDRRAVKRIKFCIDNEKEFINELITCPVIHEMKSSFICDYYYLWLENDYKTLDKEKHYTNEFILYIEMELCDVKLDDIIREMKQSIIHYTNENLTILGYLIASQLFFQILQGVQYLHQFKYQIIHRDLNPSNIMLKFGNDREMIKIADFGLSTVHKFMDHTHSANVGNLLYVAPEVTKGRRYDTQADIYSLGRVAEKLFDLNINRNYNENKLSTYYMLYQEMNILFKQMTYESLDERIKDIDKDIIQRKDFWLLTENQLKSDAVYGPVINVLQYKDNYVSKILNNLLK